MTENKNKINGCRKISQRIADKTGLELEGINIFQTRFFQEIINEVTEKGYCNIPHFGTFKLGRIKEKTIKSTYGGDVRITDWKVLKFLPAVEVKQALNKKGKTV